MHHLVYRDELGSTRMFPLEGVRPVTIGRDRTRDLVLEHRQVSRFHASIEKVSGSYLLRDAGSANGTFLNGLRLSGASAITLREGDVIEVGGMRICFATDIAGALSVLAPATRDSSEFQETVLPYADLLRDGLSFVRDQGDKADETSSQVLRSFADGPLVSALKGTLDVVVRRLDVDLAAVFLRRRANQPLELTASRPSVIDPRAIIHDVDLARASNVALVYHRKAEDALATNISDTCIGTREHSAAAVPFFRASTLLGILYVERFSGPRLERRAASVIAVYGERIARALSLRGASPNDTPVSVLGDVA